MRSHSLAFATALLTLTFTGSAATPEAVQKLADDYFAKRPTHAVQAGLTLPQARQAQREFITHLQPKLGSPVGFKVGLTSKAVQESVGASAPVRGVLLRDMILPDNAAVAASFGARPIWEPDLMVVVKDAGINDATTQLEVAQHLSELIAFIELPDRLVAENVPVDGNSITAMNSGARLGVLGQRRPITPSSEFVAALGNLRVVASDEKGTQLATASGTALLGHPLNPVLWLIKDLAATGQKLKAGDMISLGSFARPQSPEAGQNITVRYDGIPGGPLQASVRFVEAGSHSAWRSLFDGKSIAGWHVSAKTGHSRASQNKSGGRWVIEDGAIVGSQDIPGNGGLIITDEMFGDFEVSVEMNNDFGPDSGLFLRSTEDGTAWQAMIDYHTGGNLMGIYGEGKLGGKPSIANYYFIDTPENIRISTNATTPLVIAPESWKFFWRHGQWNEFRARIEGNPPHITTWINGVMIMDWTDPMPKRHPDEGGIALQVHGGGDHTKEFVRYRNVRVRTLGSGK